MRDAIEASMDGSLDVMSTVDPGNLKETDPRVFETDAAVWQSIAFKRSRDRTHSLETWRSAAFVRLNDSNELAWYGDRLEHHPVIWRSFAAYPPVSRMTMTGGPIIEAANPFGVVVGDLLGEIMKTYVPCYVDDYLLCYGLNLGTLTLAAKLPIQDYIQSFFPS